MVAFAVDEVAVAFEEVGGDEDLGAEGGEEGVEFGGGGRGEGWEGACALEELVKVSGCEGL